MSKRAIILSAVPVSTAVGRYVRPGDFIVACDAGYRNAERLDLRPDLIVGDFDSAPRPKAEHETIVLPHVKDDTDTEYAAKLVSEKGFDEVLLLGGLGCWNMAMTRSPCWVPWAVPGWNIRWQTLPPGCTLPKTA